ncbi:hypothetical protein B5C34_06025 [Pacificimonas flava]|uniref:Glycerophosphoryl diester phosphodiesterase membrane domain-containing protein n=2 Tax=Pacificimonas TaxID=1960290 RepID=A0A219B463_9SPHN|nr:MULTISPECIES: hypothetical protein [Pacificimonas]MBZ6377219.1 hypothetical protein [Pacificimonas aurantium]OWV33061.1 hypothetical protein B5C34_06025 [Pacificimonas flava]
MSFSVSKAWEATQAAIAARPADYALLVAAFVFLPNVLLDYFTAAPTEASEVLAQLRRPETLAVNLVSILGQLGVMALFLWPGRSAGAAIRRAARLWPLGILVVLAFGAISAAGLAALVLPGIYLIGRLFTVLPAYADQGRFADAFRTAWAQTPRAWWKLFFAGLILVAAFMFVALIAGIVTTLLDPSGEGLVTSLLSALVASLFSLYLAVFQAAAYVQLGAPEPVAA